jgi:two-component system NtrC family response regulator
MKPKLLIVDDDEDIRTQMKWALAKEYAVQLAEDRPSALAAFTAEMPRVVMLDLGLPPHPNAPDEGLATLSALLAADRMAKVIIVSGQGEKENTLKAVGAGAYDFLTKPVDMNELKLLLRRAFHVAGLEREYAELQQGLLADTFEGMVGTSPAMQDVFAVIRKVATSSAPVLILGESGTGKEMAALAIHRRSQCKAGPFVAINCNAIPESLMESELFGHEKGAFTGANAQRKGLIESAAGGTLFLDEIGELPLPIQVKLLRFLQEKTFQRVGGRQEIESDVRIVAATNADLKEAIKAGGFREDLYFRLAVIVLHLPPLRDRGDDMQMVAREFLKRYAAQNGRGDLAFAPDAVRALSCHRWPGNVRELQNRVQRAVIMAEGGRITAADLELTESAVEDTPGLTLKEAREQVERSLIDRCLQRHRGRISAVAQELGVSRPTLYELMQKLGIQRGE